MAILRGESMLSKRVAGSENASTVRFEYLNGPTVMSGAPRGETSQMI